MGVGKGVEGMTGVVNIDGKVDSVTGHDLATEGELADHKHTSAQCHNQCRPRRFLKRYSPHCAACMAKVDTPETASLIATVVKETAQM